MERRLLLHQLLEQLSNSAVYFQPPTNFQLQFPCVVYKRDYMDNDYADNLPYRRMKRYLVTVIDLDPDSEIPDKIAALPYCRFSRHFTKDNLNHDVYNLYF